jgi:uncharacterized protein YkwD
MRNFRVFAPFACVAAAVLALAGPAYAAPAPCANASALPGNASELALSKATVCLVNRERRRRGMRSLRNNRRLSQAALLHTVDMVEKRYFEHVSTAGTDVVDRLLSTGYLGRVRSWLVGENLAWGTERLSTPHQTVVSWMQSPKHRANILNRRFREIGIGVVFHTPNGSREPVAATYTTTFGYRR